MDDAISGNTQSDGPDHLKHWRDVGRACGGAIVFGLPMLMTEELWALGFYIDPLRLICLVLVSFPIYVGISGLIGFREGQGLSDNILDVLVAYAFGITLSAITLAVFSTLGTDQRYDIAVSAVLLQSVPASLGALVARSEMGSGDYEKDQQKRYRSDLLVMAIGALFLGFNIAPTEEVEQIAHQMTQGHTLSLVILTIAIMHVFTTASYYSRKRGGIKYSQYRLFFRYTCSAWLVATAMSLFALWVFSVTDGMGFDEHLATVMVLVFPAGIGASASRLIL